MSLLLTAKWGEKVYIGDDISFTVVREKGSQVSVAIDSPRDLTIATETQRRNRERRAKQ